MYTWGNELCRKDGEYPLEDGLGSERTVTNSSQTVTGTLNLDAFGNKVGSTGSSANPYMFAQSSAYRNDGDAGLMQVGARYYDGQVGRFITRDTVLTQKPYQYCEHDPVNAVDPSGHDRRGLWDAFWTGLGGGIGGGIAGIPGAVIGGCVGYQIGDWYWDVPPPPHPGALFIPTIMFARPGTAA